MSLDLLQERIKALVEKHGSQKAAAESVQIAHSFFHNALTGLATPPPRLLKALGLKRVVVKIVSYERSEP